MIKKSIYIIMMLLFSGCAAERGSIQLNAPHKSTKQDNRIGTVEENSIPTLVLRSKENKINTVENNLSGGLVLLIGLLILL